MRKLITFGDSFANYAWPMWPDLLAQDFDTTENYGRSGCGNSYIFNSFVTHLLRKGFDQNDTVIIQWTEPTRLDYIKEGDWVTEGSRSAEIMVENELGHYISDETVVLQQLSMMATLTQFLASSGCNWYFLFLNSPSIPFGACADFRLSQSLIKRYDTALGFLHEFKDRMITDISMSEYFDQIGMPILDCTAYLDDKLVSFKDSHPTPAYTLKFLEEVLFKKLKINNVDAVRKFALAAEQEIISQKEKNYINQNKISKFFDTYIESNNYKKAHYCL